MPTEQQLVIPSEAPGVFRPKAGSLIVLVSAIAIAVLSACSHEKPEEPGVPVKAATVEKSTIERIITTDAVLFPLQQAALVPKITAPVKKFYVNRGSKVRKGQLLVYKISPEQFGIERAPLSEILGGDVETNAGIIRAILKGEKSARRDIVLLNAAAALVAAGKAENLSQAVPMAAEALDSGAAQEKLEKLVKFTNRK